MRMYIYVVSLVGMMVLLFAAGIELPSGGLINSINIIDSDGNISFQNAASSTLFVALLAVFSGLLVTGIVIGVFGRTVPIQYITASFVLTFTTIVLIDLVALFSKLNSYGITWLTFAALGIYGSLTAGFLITAYDWWQNSD